MEREDEASDDGDDEDIYRNWFSFFTDKVKFYMNDEAFNLKLKRHIIIIFFIILSDLSIILLSIQTEDDVMM